MSGPAAKRVKTSNDDEEVEPLSFDLLALYEGDLSKKILCFASASDLCTLDILNKQFQRVTIDPWRTITEDTFGMKNGKEDWKIGSAFLREPVFMHLTDDGDYGYGDMYSGTASVAANGSIVVAVADDVEESTWSHRTYPDERFGIGIRDARTLNYIRTVPSPINNWRVAICGRVGSEIIVTTNCTQICARRGNDVQTWQYDLIPGGVPVIGCETHLIVAIGDTIEIYGVNRVGEGGDASELISLHQSVTARTGERHEIMQNISWGPDKSHFIVCHPQQICVWKFDVGTGNASLTQTIVTTDLCINNVSLADDYIVASSDDKKLHIWNRTTGEKLLILCDVDEEDELDMDDIIYPLSMSCHGHILVSTSHQGCALCVWNMNTGELLKRYIDADEERHVDMLPDGIDATDMAYLEHLNAFLCMTGFMNIWAFPTNKRQSDMAKSIRRREERLR